MGSSFEPSPKKKFGQRPASEAPAHMASGMGQKASTQISLSQIEMAVPAIAMPKYPATQMRNAFGFANGPANAGRYSPGIKSICFRSPIAGKMLRGGAIRNPVPDGLSDAT